MKMKNLMIGTAICLATTVANAQTDVKLNPVGIVFSSSSLTVESALKHNFGLEGTFGGIYQNFQIFGEGYNNYGINGRAQIKYYFDDKSKNNIDGFWSSFYLCGLSKRTNTILNNQTNVYINRLGFGFGGGYKYVNKQHVVIEFSTGIGSIVMNTNQDANGNNVPNNTLPYPIEFFGSFKIGYRFGEVNSGFSGRNRNK
jgi:Protein of unknown function (DUF3575)